MADAGTKPLKYGVIIYPGFQLIDVAGPVDILNVASSHVPGISLSLIAPTLDPISTKPTSKPPLGLPEFTTSQQLIPTHTFDNAPADLDVLIVPGGVGSFDPQDVTKPNLNIVRPIASFVKERYPQLQFLLTVCTGSGIASQTGLLDGKKATMFKGAWPIITKWREAVNWVPRSRWTEDGNIWTSGGVSSGMDLMFAFIQRVYGEEVAGQVAAEMEFIRHEDPSYDPYGIEVS
ncbi:class I glutamine amidotransferase-like protein [Xylogone sp. PMI_703]|nr:class I glutamine amidotransferase-like protein [Xylogone sp. PMI_703]